jgi:hypothetical protein
VIYHCSRHEGRYCLEVAQSGSVGAQQEVHGQEEGAQDGRQTSTHATPEDIFSDSAVTRIRYKRIKYVIV